jgi:sugar O-acyltransferase (sialic acid O-acetyltransferase NeuD family)
MKPLYGIYGAGGCGRGIMPLLQRQLINHDVEVVFIDDKQIMDSVNGYRVVSWTEFTASSHDEKAIAIAIAASSIREEIDLKRVASNIKLVDVVAENCIVMDEVEIGEGFIISPFVTLTCNIKIGRNFHCNISSYVEHDCVIGDFVTFAPGVKCNGNVHIDDHAYIGTGAILKQGTPDKPLRIGKGAVVGMGAVVTKDVEAGMTVIGNPARPMPPRS